MSPASKQRGCKPFAVDMHPGCDSCMLSCTEKFEFQLLFCEEPRLTSLVSLSGECVYDHGQTQEVDIKKLL